MFNFAHLGAASTCKIIAKVSGWATSSIQKFSSNQHTLASLLSKTQLSNIGNVPCLGLFAYRSYKHRLATTTSIYWCQMYVNVACTADHKFLPYVCSLH